MDTRWVKRVPQVVAQKWKATPHIERWRFALGFSVGVAFIGIMTGTGLITGIGVLAALFSSKSAFAKERKSKE